MSQQLTAGDRWTGSEQPGLEWDAPQKGPGLEMKGPKREPNPQVPLTLSTALLCLKV